MYDPSDQITSVISSIHSTLPSTPKRLPLVAPPTQVEQTSIDNFASLVVWEILLFGISLPSNATVSSSPTPSTYLRGTQYETRMLVPLQSRTTFGRQLTSSQTLVFQIHVTAQQIIHITTTSFYISLKLYSETRNNSKKWLTDKLHSPSTCFSGLQHGPEIFPSTAHHVAWQISSVWASILASASVNTPSTTPPTSTFGLSHIVPKSFDPLPYVAATWSFEHKKKSFNHLLPAIFIVQSIQSTSPGFIRRITRTVSVYLSSGSPTML